MKTLHFKSYRGMAAVCAMLTLASCGNDIELAGDAPAKNPYKITLTASQEGSATRTALDGIDVVWQTGDAITVFDGGGNNCTFELSKGAGETTGEFEGTINALEPKSYCAVYPAVENATINADHGISGLSLPVEQKATPDGFDPQAAIMTARNDNADKITSTAGDLTLGEFKHVCAFVKVTTTEPYDKITFTTNGGEGIAGSFSVTLDENGISTVAPAADASTTVSLVPAYGETEIAAGTYLIAVLPGALTEGFTMSCSKDDVTNSQIIIMTRSYGNAVGETVFARHNIVNMGTVEETLATVTWERSAHDYVDLGLGVKWATHNVGADTPYGSGDYFAWGETEPKDDYSWETYKWSKDSYGTLTKYVSFSWLDDVDNKEVLEAEDDAATANWHGTWRTPTINEIIDLRNKCYWEWTENYNNSGVNGYVVYRVYEANSSDRGKIKNAKVDFTPSGTYTPTGSIHIFLPANGWRTGTTLVWAGARGYFWSASANTTYNGAFCPLIYSDDVEHVCCDERFLGLNVRPVCP
ncbi:MAG: hypothetical protein II844_09445 [Prevotella sp.]|nr:hypothetical protein [Prevotella sp.]